MAERTGVPEIDLLVEQFLRDGDPEIGDGDELSSWLRQPQEAEGECGFISGLFAERLSAEDLHAYCSGRRAKAANYPHSRNPLLGTTHTPDDFGYGDRSRSSQFPEHAATIVEAENGSIFMIDWTASQFGYSEFPMVQRWDGGSWQRNF